MSSLGLKQFIGKMPERQDIIYKSHITFLLVNIIVYGQSTQYQRFLLFLLYRNRTSYPNLSEALNPPVSTSQVLALWCAPAHVITAGLFLLNLRSVSQDFCVDFHITCGRIFSQSEELAQQFRELLALAKDLGSILSTHKITRTVCDSSTREPEAHPDLEGHQACAWCIYTFRQSAHTHKIIILKKSNFSYISKSQFSHCMRLLKYRFLK